MKKISKRILSLFLALIMLISVAPAGTISAQAATPSLQKSIDWAVAIANDDSHGYSQFGRNGPDYDCSSFVGTALYNGGFTSIGTNLTTMTTPKEENYLRKLGFNNVASSVNLSTGSGLRAGDVLWKSGHTEMYIGNNKLVGAHQSHTYCSHRKGHYGCYQCGEQKGDQGYYYKNQKL